VTPAIPNMLMLGIVVASCGQAGGLGRDEPMRALNAIFVPAPLPGRAATGNPAADAGPTVTAIETTTTVFRRGDITHTVLGRTSTDAFALAFALVAPDAGHWLIPVDGPDPSANDELTWALTLDVPHHAPLGPQTLSFVATDAEGIGGVRRDLAVCVTPEVPDNLNACDKTRKPPALVLALEWNSHADLDLVIDTPGGKRVDAKHPTTGTAEDGRVPTAVINDPKTGRFERDSGANCNHDERRREHLVFTEWPAAGEYRIHVLPFDACGSGATTFRVSSHRRLGIPDGTYGVEETPVAEGSFIAAQFNGSRSLPLAVGAVTVEEGAGP